MTRVWSVARLVLTIALVAAWANEARAQGGFTQVIGKDFDRAMPKDFYLEGNAIPTNKLNAALLKTAAGSRVLLSLIDTAGYSSQIQQKYIGMVVTEGKISVCGISLGVGSFGFGLVRPAATSNEDAKFFLYDQAGQQVGECAAKKDATIKQAKPLSVVLGEKRPARLVLGRYAVVLE